MQDEMFSLQKSASDRTSLGYGFSSSNIASTVKTVLASGNLDKGKSILGASPKQDKKEAKNPKAKKANS